MKDKKQTETKDFIKEKFNTLEVITKELEEASLPLEQLVNRYEEGMKITQEVKQFLAEMEGRIINISEQ